MHCEIITIIKVINISLRVHSYSVCVCVYMSVCFGGAGNHTQGLTQAKHSFYLLKNFNVKQYAVLCG